MKITAIHGRSGGSTHAVAAALLKEIQKRAPDAEISEFVVAGFQPCAGCFTCFAKGEEHCPHYQAVHPIAASVEASEVVILDSPTYCLGISGAMKSFLDHLAYRWFAHRPHPSMASKLGVAVSTTGSMGAKGVAKALKKHFFGWSVAKCYRLSFAVMGTSWDDISEKKKRRILRSVEKTVGKIVKRAGKVKRGPYLRLILSAMKVVQKKNTWFPLDKAWWREQGWL